MTRAQATALLRRFEAAQRLERAGQVTREAARYGLATQQHADMLHDAERDYAQFSTLAGWVVISR